MSESYKEDIKVDFNIGLEPIEGTEKLTFRDLKLTSNDKWNLFWTRKNPQSGLEKKEFFFWNPPGRSSYEKKLVFKLDWIVLAYCCLSFFIKYLDQSNISNAYISGMKEDLNLEGSMYNWLQETFLIAYSVCGLFGTLLLTRISPHIILPLFEIIWGVLCLLVIVCNTFPKLIAIRALLGAFEGITYPAIHYILGSWYTPEELNARTAIFIASGSAGTMFGGYIQSGIYATLDGKAGLPGWKWIFVIDFIITLPVAIFGYLILPGTPERPRKSYFLSEEDFEYCRKRVQVVENVEKVNKFDFSILKRALSSWQFYIFGIGYVVSQLTEECTNYWGIVLKAQGYNTYQRNNIPTIQSAVKIVSSIIAGLYSDIRRNRWEISLIVCFFWISGLGILVKYDVPRAAQFYGNSVLGVCAAYSVIIVSWANEMCKEDEQLRAFVLGSLNLLMVGADVPYSIIVWDTDNSPRFHLGMTIGLSFCIFLVFFTFIVVLFDRYQNRIRDLYNKKVNSGSIEYTTNEVDEETKSICTSK